MGLRRLTLQLLGDKHSFNTLASARITIAT